MKNISIRVRKFPEKPIALDPNKNHLAKASCRIASRTCNFVTPYSGKFFDKEPERIHA